MFYRTDGARRDVGSQTDADQPLDGSVAPVGHAASVGEDTNRELRAPLIYVEIVEAKFQAADAVIRMIALMREELGRLPTSLPTNWTIHRLHSDRGSELLPKNSG